MAVHFNISRANPDHVRDLRRRYHLETMHRTVECDPGPSPTLPVESSCDAYALRMTASTDPLRIPSEGVTLIVTAKWFSRGSASHALRVSAYGSTCGSDAQCGEIQRTIGADDRMRNYVDIGGNPGGLRDIRVFRGDFNGDGRSDLLVVLANGAGLVFEQRP